MFKSTNSQKLSALDAALSAAGISADDVLAAAEGENPVKAAIEKAASEIASKKAAKQATELAEERVADADRRAGQAERRLEEVCEKLQAAGIRIDPSASEEQVEQAIEKTISREAAKIAAKAGVDTPLKTRAEDEDEEEEIEEEEEGTRRTGRVTVTARRYLQAGEKKRRQLFRAEFPALKRGA